MSVLSLFRHSSLELHKDKEFFLTVVFTLAFGELPYGGQTERESYQTLVGLSSYFYDSMNKF